MSQFDVYKNPNSRTKKLYPYMVDIQSPFIDDISTRIVIPLGRTDNLKLLAMSTLTPEVIFQDDKYLLLTPQIASIPKNILKEPVGSLSEMRNEIISAIDFSIVGF